MIKDRANLTKPVSRSHFNFQISRFLSSPDLAPGITITAHVLCDSTHYDLDQVVEYFGSLAVKDVLDRMVELDGVHPRAQKFCEDHLSDRGLA